MYENSYTLWAKCRSLTLKQMVLTITVVELSLIFNRIWGKVFEITITQFFLPSIRCYPSMTPRNGERGTDSWVKYEGKCKRDGEVKEWVAFGCKILDNFQLAASGRKRREEITTLLRMGEFVRGKEENMPIISSMIQIYTAILSPLNRRKQMMFANIACRILWVAIKIRSTFSTC